MPSAASTAVRVRAAELARTLGVSRQAVADLVARRVIERGDDGLIDLDLARHAILSRVRPSGKTAAAAGAGAAPAGDTTPADPANGEASVTSYHVAKTLREAAEASLAELRLAKERGLVVDAAAVRAEHAKAAVAFREALLQIAARLAPVLAAETDQARIETMLDLEHRQALQQFAASEKAD